jgi:hypothetical protein
LSKGKGPQHDVFRFDVALDDPCAMRDVEYGRALNGELVQNTATGARPFVLP